MIIGIKNALRGWQPTAANPCLQDHRIGPEPGQARLAGQARLGWAGYEGFPQDFAFGRLPKPKFFPAGLRPAGAQN